MSLLIVAPTRNGNIWKDGMLAIDPNLDIEIWPEVSDPAKITCAVVWNHPAGVMNDYPNLKLVCSMGAGVDHILKDTTIADQLPITRIVEEKLSNAMSNYIIMAVLNYHKNFYRYQEHKQNKVWDQQIAPETEVSVGIMGIGVLGQDAALKLNALGFEVHGLSRTKKSIPGIKCYAEDEAPAFYHAINVLVCLLPYIPANHGILNKSLFDQLNRGTYLINVARGKHQKEADIIAAIDSGQLSGAFLDVFEQEPLPSDSPIWSHPKIQFTPHIASITNPEAAIPQIVDNYHRSMKGEKLLNLIDRKKGY
uniref:2-hydroxyacid dehydrogenase n=1 Tax=Fulvivirga sp. TaxID=1931237 RepID=UPI004049BBCE